MRVREYLLLGSIWAVFGVASAGAAPKASVKVSQPAYARAPTSIVNEYRSFLLSHPGSSLEAAQGGSGSYIVRFSGTGACSGSSCMTTVLLPDGRGNLFQAFSQKVADLRLIQNPHGGPPYLLTDDGGVWVPAGSIYVEDLHSLGSFDVPSHYLGGATKGAVDSVLEGERWPMNSPYVVSVVPASGSAPETMVVIPDQTTKQGSELCSGVACPLWILVPKAGGGWHVDAKTSGSGAYAVLKAVNADGGHDLGVADQYGWNQFSWSVTQGRWMLTHVTANFPAPRK